MDNDHEEDTSAMVCELEENEEEEANVIEKNTLDEVALKRLRELPKSRAGTKSMCMEQFILLEKNEVKRLKGSPQDDKDCDTHQCKHCNECCTFPWKMRKNY